MLVMFTSVPVAGPGFALSSRSKTPGVERSPERTYDLNPPPSLRTVVRHSTCVPSANALKRPRPCRPWSRRPASPVWVAVRFQLPPSEPKVASAFSASIPVPSSDTRTASTAPSGLVIRSTLTSRASASSAFHTSSSTAAIGADFESDSMWSGCAWTYICFMPSFPRLRPTW